MADVSDLNAIADAVLVGHAVIEKHGTRDMQRLSRTLLLAIGKEIVRQSRPSNQDSNPGPDEAVRSLRPLAIQR